MDEFKVREAQHHAREQARKEQALYASQLGQVGGAMTPMGENYADDRAKSAQEPLRVRVEQRLRRITNDAQDLMRIQALLNEHPEFEQFIELQNLLNRRGL